MTQRVKIRRILKWILVIAVAAPVLLLLASELRLLPWSRVNCSRQDVDIYSGRIRHTRYLLYFSIDERIEDSALTKALLPGDLAGVSMEWHPVVTFSPGLQHSPHYIFHSAISQISELELNWKYADFTPAARRVSARRVLQLWQQSKRDSGPRNYLSALGTLVFQDNAEARKIDVNDLPAL